MSFDAESAVAGSQQLTFTESTGQLSFIAAVPEPSTYAMALTGLACGGYSLFRRRKRA